MSCQGPVSDWTECSSSAEPPAVARNEGGSGGSAEHSYYQSSKGTDRIKDEHKVNSHVVKLQELWKTPQIQTVHIPKSMTEESFLKHPDLTIGQKRYLCSIAKIYNANYLRTLMKRQYMHVIQRSSQKPGKCSSRQFFTSCHEKQEGLLTEVICMTGVLTHHRSHLSSRHSEKQHFPCTTWRHQLEREGSGPSNTTAASAPEMNLPHSLWRPVRNRQGITQFCCKYNTMSIQEMREMAGEVSTSDSESYMNEEKKEEDLLNKYMQSMSIEEQGEHLMLT
ncbi:Protein FAM216A [Camelus dromedarius]|uniref:Protein FAM216A n=1 Tax=Camelus dromedarius TaxID=9838 RepID=A0A5N4C993_CAMDR|nr:Protein FAM216A [Camelus dromedarius]